MLRQVFEIWIGKNKIKVAVLKLKDTLKGNDNLLKTIANA